MAKGRPLQHDREQALEAAMHVFWQKGYEATSMQDLMAATTLSKSSLYQGFGNKHRLFLKCLERFQHHTVSDLRQRLSLSDTGLAFIQDVLYWVIDEAAHDEASPKGCLLVNTATEFSQNDIDVSHRVSDAFSDYRTIFFEAAQKGQLDGSIRNDQPTEYLANYFVTCMSGLRTMVKAGSPVDDLRRVVAMMIASLR